uniref:GAG-pre-integrase domain-containing protein n=1 Tax=Tanacetum cinerariifolium TaxID=118510 RepID=A0A699HGT3_TANCI|nr:hypothetical protein [Tanacetum cinerariifolium]
MTTSQDTLGIKVREFGHFAKECRKPKRVKDSAYHKQKMLLCKQAEQGVPLQAKQYDWLMDTDEEVDEQELEAHYNYMAKIQEHMTYNLKLLCNFVEKFLGTVCFGNDHFAPILGYGDLVQGNGNDLLIDNRGSNLYTISLHESTSSTPLCLMAKAKPNQAWLWHRRLSHLNFDYINLLSKKDIVIGLPKLKYVKDQLCSSCELSKSKRSSFKSKAIPSSKGRLNLFHMDLCGPMRVASINGKKYILVIVDDYSRYMWTLFLRSKDEAPKVLKDFPTMIQRNLQSLVINKASDYDNPDPVPQRQDVFSSADADVPSPQELDLLFGPLYDEIFNAGSNPSTNIQSTSAPSTHTNVHAEEKNNDQAEEGE